MNYSTSLSWIITLTNKRNTKWFQYIVIIIFFFILFFFPPLPLILWLWPTQNLFLFFHTHNRARCRVIKCACAICSCNIITRLLRVQLKMCTFYCTWCRIKQWIPLCDDILNDKSKGKPWFTCDGRLEGGCEDDPTFYIGLHRKKNSKPDRARQFCFQCEPIFSLKIRLCAAFFPCWKCLNLTVAWTNLNGPTTRLLHF